MVLQLSLLFKTRHGIINLVRVLSIDNPNIYCYDFNMNKAKILIIDDDKFLRELYYEILTNENYAVDLASDGEEGLRKLTEGGYDLVLLDIVMAKINGIDIMKQV